MTSSKNCALLLENSKTLNQFKIESQIDYISQRCLNIIRFFPDYFDNWNHNKRLKFLSCVIYDEFPHQPGISANKVNETILLRMQEINLRRWETLKECSHCGDFVHDPVLLPSGELVDRN